MISENDLSALRSGIQSRNSLHRDGRPVCAISPCAAVLQWLGPGLEESDGLTPDIGLDRGPEPPETAFLAFKSLRTVLDAGFASDLLAAFGLILSVMRWVVCDVQSLDIDPCLTRE